MTELKLTGGARIGIVNASFPFATLTVNKTKLELNASIIGNLIFQASDIVSIEPYGIIPVIGQGIKINHKVGSYNKKVIFWTMKDPKTVIQQIKQIGFLDKGNINQQPIDREIIEKQSKGGFPIKKGFAIAALIIWSLLFLFVFASLVKVETEGFPIGKEILLPIGFIFLMALLSLVSPAFRRLVLKEGRGLEDIKKFAYFILFISGFMFFIFGIMLSILNQ